jgi:hypothetical protein
LAFVSLGPECVVMFVQHTGAVCKKKGGGGLHCLHISKQSFILYGTF